MAARRQRIRQLADAPEGLAQLCARLDGESDPSVRDAILVQLIKHKGAGVVGGLLPYLSSDDASLRGAVIEALQDMPDELAAFIPALLADPDADVRQMTVGILAALPHNKVPDWLTAVVLRDESLNVCAAAVDCLAEIGNDDAIPALYGLLQRFPGVPFLDFAVKVAIRNIRGV